MALVTELRNAADKSQFSKIGILWLITDNRQFDQIGRRSLRLLNLNPLSPGGSR